MANISDAFGTITIKAKNKELIKKLIMLINYRLTPVDNCTFLPDLEPRNLEPIHENYKIVSDIIDKDIIQCDEYFTMTTSFGGSGRWSYATNMDNFKKWIQNEPKYIHLTNTDEINKILNTWFNDIKDQDMLITFEFTDSEAGFAWISTGTITYQMRDWSIVEEDIYNYEYTAHNLKEIVGQLEAVDFTKECLLEVLEHLEYTNRDVELKLKDNRNHWTNSFIAEFVHYAQGAYHQPEDLIDAYPELVEFFIDEEDLGE